VALRTSQIFFFKVLRYNCSVFLWPKVSSSNAHFTRFRRNKKLKIKDKKYCFETKCKLRDRKLNTFSLFNFLFVIPFAPEVTNGEGREKCVREKE